MSQLNTDDDSLDWNHKKMQNIRITTKFWFYIYIWYMGYLKNNTYIIYFLYIVKLVYVIFQ